MIYPPQQLSNAMTSLLNLRDFFASMKSLKMQQSISEAESFLSFCFKHAHQSKAQLFQDLFVMHRLKEKRGGFFVEFGATNGVDLSNTWLLEKEYGWRGILAEPAVVWHIALKANRGCAIDTRCVWDQTGEELVFNEVTAPEYSTVNSLSTNDMHASIRTQGSQYAVQTVSLNDLLADYQAPQQIDFMSIDTEGSELKILSGFDFKRYQVQTLTVEHNFGADRELLHTLLTAKGFRRTLELFSQFDDWYVRV
jgi:FkbM family methyltransferase